MYVTPYLARRRWTHCAAFGPNTLVVDHAKAPAEKSLPRRALHFYQPWHDACKFYQPEPAFQELRWRAQWDFTDLVDRHNIAWHEKTLGQLLR
jgi:hypothetical protein